MKKTSVFKSIVAALAASTLFACTQDMTDNLTVQTESDANVMKELPKYRTYEEALAVAQDAIGLLGESSTTRSGKPRTVNTNDVQYILNSSSTRLDDEPDTLMYVFNYEDSAGFAVVSANRATEELIAVTEQGNYVAGEETGNGGFDLYMDLAAEYTSLPKPPLKDSIKDGPVGFKQVRCETIIDTSMVGPYLNVQWGQDSPYNKNCYQFDGSKAAAGCVATAIAQIMSYYKHPSSILISYEIPSYNYSLDWNDILKHRRSSYNDCQCEDHEMIGKLIRQIGNLVKMQYGDQSGAYDKDVPYALSVLGYKHGAYTSYTSSKITSSLVSKKLVYMSGVRNGNVGHAWVVDGYKCLTCTYNEYMKEDYEIHWTLTNHSVESVMYHHINWGWNGYSNGYFIKNVFDAASPKELDPGVYYTVDKNYDTNLNIYPNIEIK